MHTDAAVMTIIARALIDPDFLARLKYSKDEVLKEHCLGDDALADFESFDVDRLCLFSGFIVRVKHNFLWDVIPRTLRLLKKTGRELLIFTEYAKTYLALPKPHAREESVQAFCSHLKGYLIAAVRGGELYYENDIFAHEHTMWQLHRVGASSSERLVSFEIQSRTVMKHPGDIIPIFCGKAIVARYSIDPRHEECDDARGANAVARSDNDVWLLYSRRSPAAPVLIVALPKQLGPLFQHIDGTRSISELVQLTDRKAGAAFMIDIASACESMADSGVLRLQSVVTYRPHSSH